MSTSITIHLKSDRQANVVGGCHNSGRGGWVTLDHDDAEITLHARDLDTLAETLRTMADKCRKLANEAQQATV